MENFLQTSKKARYWTLGNPNSDKILYVLHGYGQLAEYFIKNFEVLVDLGYFIVAPEGTQRFYLNGNSGRVGASWMTKELRDLDIEENLTYLDLLHQEISKNKNYNSVSLLGFSQGGATAARWKAKTEVKFSKFVLWACVFPDDVKIDFDELKQDVCQKSFVVGNQDEYFSASTIDELSEFYKKINFDVFLFDGTHKIDLDELLLIFKTNKNE